MAFTEPRVVWNVRYRLEVIEQPYGPHSIEPAPIPQGDFEAEVDAPWRPTYDQDTVVLEELRAGALQHATTTDRWMPDLLVPGDHYRVVVLGATCPDPDAEE